MDLRQKAASLRRQHDATQRRKAASKAEPQVGDVLFGSVEVSTDLRHFRNAGTSDWKPLTPGALAYLCDAYIHKAAETVTRVVLGKVAEHFGKGDGPTITKGMAASPHPVLRDAGIFNAALEYQPGDACTDRGSMWVCRAATRAGDRPPSASWRLLFKSQKPASRDS